MKKKLMALILILVFILTAVPVYPVQAAVKYTGTYAKTWKQDEPLDVHPTYSVTINKVKNKKVRFQVTYAGRNASPLYDTKVITAKLKNKTASFKWKDSWGNSGTGKLKLGKGYIKIKMKQKKTAKWNRATLDTSGKYMKLKKKNNRKKVYSW